MSQPALNASLYEAEVNHRMSTSVWTEQSSASDLIDDVTVTRSTGEVLINVPRLTSPHQQLALIGDLHEICIRPDFSASDIALDVSAIDELPLPLMIVLSMFEQDLRSKGRRLRIEGVHSEQMRSRRDEALVVSCAGARPLRSRLNVRRTV